MESSLYAPVKAFLEAQGYRVRAEVQHSDVAALRTNEKGEEELLVVELKQGLTIDLLLQGVKRQKSADLVYLAVPRPKRFWFEARWRDILHLLRRLELGLLLVVPEEAAETKGRTANRAKPVSAGKGGLKNAADAILAAIGGGSPSSKNKSPKDIQAVEIVLEPKAFDRAQSVARAKKVRNRMLTEVRERTGDYNVGGSTGQPLVTLYRERAIDIAALIAKADDGTMSIAKLRKAGAHGDTVSKILQNNVYGWFVRAGRGSYSLSADGKAALEEFAVVVKKGSAR